VGFRRAGATDTPMTIVSDMKRTLVVGMPPPTSPPENHRPDVLHLGDDLLRVVALPDPSEAESVKNGDGANIHL
jgi:hypothetical protein